MLLAATIILSLSLLLSLSKLLMSPASEDKVIVIDILSFQLLGLTILLALHDKSALPLQFAFILALLGFLSTLILSLLIKKNYTL